MQFRKMSLDNIQGKLSRVEMKNIMAGSSSCGESGVICILCTSDDQFYSGKVCRSSPSCSEPKVCAKPYYC